MFFTKSDDLERTRMFAPAIARCWGSNTIPRMSPKTEALAWLAQQRTNADINTRDASKYRVTILLFPMEFYLLKSRRCRPTKRIELSDSTTVSRYRAAAHLEQHPQTASGFTFESGEEGWRPTRNAAPAQANARLGEIFVKITKAGAGWRAWPFRMRKHS